MPAPTVVFDLDGTLIDTAPDLVAAMNAVLTREGLNPIDDARARLMIGGGARRMLESGLQAEGRAAPAADLDRMVADFIAHYTAHIADGSKPYPGLEDALDRLELLGCRFAVCTNKLERLSRLLLDRLGMTARFAAICGQDTFGIQKPNPEVLHRTLAAAGGHAKHAIMVGDSRTDIATAQAAGLPVIAVNFGYTDVPVEQLGPDRIIGHFNELEPAIQELAAAWA